MDTINLNYMLIVVQMDLKLNVLTKKIKIHHSSPWKKANNFKIKISTILYLPEAPFIFTEFCSINGGNIEHYFYLKISISYLFLWCIKWLILFQDVYKSICHFLKRFLPYPWCYWLRGLAHIDVIRSNKCPFCFTDVLSLENLNDVASTTS